jgi:hypothetical protein
VLWLRGATTEDGRACCCWRAGGSGGSCRLQVTLLLLPAAGAVRIFASYEGERVRVHLQQSNSPKTGCGKFRHAPVERGVQQ